MTNQIIFVHKGIASTLILKIVVCIYVGKLSFTGL